MRKQYALALLSQKCPECGDTGTGWPAGICQTCDGGRDKRRLAEELGYEWDTTGVTGASSYAGCWREITKSEGIA